MTTTPVPPDVRDANTGATRFEGLPHHRTWRATPVKPAPTQENPLFSPHGARRCGYRPMTVVDEVSFAWALSSVAGGLFSRRERA